MMERRQMLKGTCIGIREHLLPRLERAKKYIRENIGSCISRRPQYIMHKRPSPVIQKQNIGVGQHERDWPAYRKEITKAVYFQGQFSNFSNIYQCPTEREGTKHHCIEQYYQAAKAKRNGNSVIHVKIMLEKDPTEIYDFLWHWHCLA